MAKKTIQVEWLKEKTNEFLALSAPEMKEQRFGMAAILEAVLFETHNYKGYGFNATEYLPAELQTTDQVLREGYDESRRRYF